MFDYWNLNTRRIFIRIFFQNPQFAQQLISLLSKETTNILKRHLLFCLFAFYIPMGERLMAYENNRKCGCL